MREAAVRTWIRYSQSSIARRLVGGAVWGIGAAIAASALNLLVMIAVARMLGRETYGQLVLAQSTIGTVGAIAGFGVGATVTRYAAHLRGTDIERLSRIITLTQRVVIGVALVFALALALAADVIAAHVLRQPELAMPLRIMALVVLISVVDGYQKSVLIGFEAMRALAVGTLLGVAFGAPFVVGLAHRFGITGAAAGLAASALTQAAVSRVQMMQTLRRHSVPARATAWISEWRVLRDFSLPALVSGVIVMIAHWAAQTLLARSPGGLGQVALLGAAMQWFNATTLLPGVAARVMLPVLTERLAMNQREQAFVILKATVAATLAVGIPAAAVVSLASPWIMGGYGTGFGPGAPALALVAWIGVLVVACMPVGHLLAAADRMWLGAAMNLGWAVVYVGGSLWVTGLTAMGVVRALGLAYLGHSVWVLAYAARSLRATRGRRLATLSS